MPDLGHLLSYLLHESLLLDGGALTCIRNSLGIHRYGTDLGNRNWLSIVRCL